ncbi:MAG: hypothetical protein JSV50_11825, partial [Desulfobacteraceae bacterium]
VQRQVMKRDDVRDISSGRISKDAIVKQPKRKQRVIPEDSTDRNGKQVKFQDRELNRKVKLKTGNQRTDSRGLQDERKWSPPKPVQRQVMKRDDVRDISSGRISKDAIVKQPKRKQRLVSEDRANRTAKQAKFQERGINRQALPKTEDKGKFSTRLQDERKWSPSKPVQRQVMKRDDQRIFRSELQERKRSIPSKPVRESSMRQEDKGRTIYQSLKTKTSEPSKRITRNKIQSSSPRLARGEIQEERKGTASRGSVNVPSRFNSARGGDRGRHFKN